MGTTFHPQVGNPKRKDYCVICGCYEDPKGRNVKALLRCQRLVCAPTNCKDPVLLPGKCCKVCPEDVKNMVEDVPITEDEEDTKLEHFAALLTSDTSQFLINEDTRTAYELHVGAVATARLQLEQKDLYYSFYLKADGARPNYIQFVNEKGLIYKEQSLTLAVRTDTGDILSSYQNDTGKICGVWHRVPRKQRKLVREGRLYVVLIWRRAKRIDRALAGELRQHESLQHEQFSALLVPPMQASTSAHVALRAAGATAIVALTKAGNYRRVNLTLLFNGIVSNTLANGTATATVNVQLEWPKRKLQLSGEVHKPNARLNVVQVSMPIVKRYMRSLASGAVLLTIQAESEPALRLRGYIKTRATCQIYQTLLVPATDTTTTTTTAMENDLTMTTTTTTALTTTTTTTTTTGLTALPQSMLSAGLAWAYVKTNGALVYHIKMEPPANAACNGRTHISLLSGQRLFEDRSIACAGLDYVNGSIASINAKMFDTLYGDALNLKITYKAQRLLGRFVARPVADARDSAKPLLLQRVPGSVSDITAMAWLAIDNECQLYYDLSTHGLSTSAAQAYEIVIEQMPTDEPGAPVTTIPLGYLNGSAHAESRAPRTLSLRRLQHEISYLIVRRSSNEPHKQRLLQAKIEAIKVPAHCASYDKNNQQMELDDSEYYGERKRLCRVAELGRYINETQIYRNPKNVCEICSCKNGASQCEPIICPVLASSSCKPGELLMKRAGECCASCVPQQYANSTAGCRLGEQFYLIGATFHPYLPPNGQDQCIRLRCEPTLRISSAITQCPALNCEPSLAYRPSSSACCKVCPPMLNTMPMTRSALTPYTSYMSRRNNTAAATAIAIANQNNQNNQNFDMRLLKYANPSLLFNMPRAQHRMRSDLELLGAGGCRDMHQVLYENGQEFCRSYPSERSGQRRYLKCRCKDSNFICDKMRYDCPRLELGSSIYSPAATPLLLTARNIGDRCCYGPSALNFSLMFLK